MYAALIALIGLATLTAVIVSHRRQKRRRQLQHEIDAWVFHAKELQERKRHEPRLRA